MANLTYQDVYEIASEVAEETITKFLQNLVKLVPAAQDIQEGIQERQFEALRKNKKRKPVQESFDYPEDDEDSDEFEQIAHPKRMQESVVEDDFAKIAHPNKPMATGLEDDFLGAIDMPPLGINGLAPEGVPEN